MKKIHIHLITFFFFFTYSIKDTIKTKRKNFGISSFCNTITNKILVIKDSYKSIRTQNKIHEIHKQFPKEEAQ